MNFDHVIQQGARPFRSTATPTIVAGQVMTSPLRSTVEVSMAAPARLPAVRLTIMDKPFAAPERAFLL